MSVISAIDRQFISRGKSFADDFSRIFLPHEFTQDEWLRLMRDHYWPEWVAHNAERGLSLPDLGPEAFDAAIQNRRAEQREAFCRALKDGNLSSAEITAMLPSYQAGVLQGRPTQTFLNKNSFTAADSGSTYTVPAVAFQLIGKLWGAGAGSGSANGGSSADAGGGGFQQGTINATPGESLTKRVGGKGTKGANADSTGGGGAGYTGLFRSGAELLIAAGGGGSGCGRLAGTFGGAGGPGGGATGGDGADSNTPTAGLKGTGGTPSAGGTGGAGVGGKNGTDGSSLTGGKGGGLGNSSGGQGGTNGGGDAFTGTSATTDRTGGGAGAGHQGGGGGGAGVGSGGGGGGGGGSNFAEATATATVSTQATGKTPPATGDPDYAGSAGLGAVAFSGTGNGLDGNDGLLVLIY